MKKFKIIKDYSQILFIGLFLFGYLFGQIFFDSKVEIAQAAPKIAPTVNSVFISTAVNGLVDSYPGGTITPTVATSTTLHINGIVGDANGSADIVSVNTTFYRSLATSTFNCVLDNNSCYKVA
ncbi:MAG: hypothetical protein NT091_04530, partial [Candidatus Falkowbacteria bacterium]|nr:hypothetical protein [Candidatus Falkowbacteria bacterium]